MWELRYGRVQIVESTPAHIHVRWSYQSCDFKYKVWGDSAVEDFHFYRDGFGTRVLTLQSVPTGDYELSEFIILTPQETDPLSVLPPNLVDILFLDGQKRELRFPFFPNEQGDKAKSRDMPGIYRVRLHKDDPMTAVYFNPLDTQLPPTIFGPFSDRGQLVTPCYWGSHWPLARGKTTDGAIDDRVHFTPCVDDASSDRTSEIAEKMGIRTIIHETNLGYGANQKTCYRAALELGADIIIMVHPDYQYTPKLIPALASMIAYGEFDAVLGSRILGVAHCRAVCPSISTSRTVFLP